LVGVIGWYYLWAVRSTGHGFEWDREHFGYYNYLGRAFASGSLWLPIEPAPQLLAAANPWDPATNNEYKMHDMAFYKGRYFLYHGAAPAVLLFAPYRVLRGRDLPEHFALLLFCLGGFLFSAAALLRWFDLAGVRVGLGMRIVAVFAAGLCQGVPFLLSRVWVYEIAIGCGYFCVWAGLYLFLRGEGSRRAAAWRAAAGTLFGLAIASRPHLGLVGAAFALALLARKAERRTLLAYCAPLVGVGALIGLYNLLRFGTPLEFGTSYLLAGANQNRIVLSVANVAPGLYYFLFCAPEFEPVFPWVRIVTRYPFDLVSYSFPPQYFVESIVGGFYLAPFAAACVWISRGAAEAARHALWAMVAASAGVLLFLSATGFTAQRYELDFLPLALFAGLANLMVLAERRTGWRRMALRAAVTAAVVFGATVNLAMGIGGLYDEMQTEKPQRYLRLARRFTRDERLMPLLNPAIDVAFAARFRGGQDGVNEPLFSMGRRACRYFLSASHSGGRIRLVSRNQKSSAEYELGEAPAADVEVRVRYDAASGTVTVALDGRPAITHEIGPMMTAPVEVRVGEAPRDDSLSTLRFTGRIDRPQVRIGP
jgi:hypothetical protein